MTTEHFFDPDEEVEDRDVYESILFLSILKCDKLIIIIFYVRLFINIFVYFVICRACGCWSVQVLSSPQGFVD